ncbi:MAG: ATP-binding cassette domain-containing protein [bacterium]|nr:ATP-binding cassette domain-containing protein [bacterium]
MIQVKGLTKCYGALAAVDDVSFDVERGEIVGFLGPNGAGKTTTMRVITGCTPATRGGVRIAGYHVDDNPIEVKRRIGYLPESVPLYPEMIVSSYLGYVAEVKGLGGRARRIEVDRAMDRAGLGGMERRIIKNLSKGYRQRVGLAQALLGSPPVLILDEPTEGLDPRQIIEIRQMIRDLATDHTVLLSTHILPEAALVCERVLIINRGRLVASDTTGHLAGVGDTIALEVEAHGPLDALLRSLKAVPGVDRVTAENTGQYVVHGENSPEIRGAVARALVQGGFQLHQMKIRTRSLEDLFIEAVSQDGEATPGGEGGAS